MFAYTPHRKTYEKNDDVCMFCNPEQMDKQAIRDSDGNIIENDYYIWVVNVYPKFDGHTMIIPKRHIEMINEETPEEVTARNELMVLATNKLMELFECDGVEIFMQYGTDSRRSVKHMHWHITPARSSDPLRSFEKLGHFYTTNENDSITLKYPIEVTEVKEVLQEKLKNIL